MFRHLPLEAIGADAPDTYIVFGYAAACLFLCHICDLVQNATEIHIEYPSALNTDDMVVWLGTRVPATRTFDLRQCHDDVLFRHLIEVPIHRSQTDTG